MTNAPTFSRWEREDVDAFALLAYMLLVRKHEVIEEQQRRIKDLEKALQHHEDDWK